MAAMSITMIRLPMTIPLLLLILFLFPTGCSNVRRSGLMNDTSILLPPNNEKMMYVEAGNTSENQNVAPTDRPVKCEGVSGAGRSTASGPLGANASRLLSYGWRPCDAGNRGQIRIRFRTRQWRHPIADRSGDRGKRHDERSIREWDAGYQCHDGPSHARWRDGTAPAGTGRYDLSLRGGCVIDGMGGKGGTSGCLAAQDL
jgi:hypothetical protein